MSCVLVWGYGSSRDTWANLSQSVSQSVSQIIGEPGQMPRLNFNQQNEVMELLQALVKINSVNDNDEQGNRDQSEKEISGFIEKYLVGLGMTVTRHPFSPGRDNLVAHWAHQEGEKSIALQSHMDTVGVANMSINPFGGGILDGKVWGRGSCDTKGSMAAFLIALSAAKKKNYQFKDKIYFVATVAEETGCKGAEALIAEEFKVDGIVVGEPTMSRLVTAHKGTMWAELSTTGTSCHASLPHLGKNAIYGMGKALSFITNDYLPSLEKQSHPLLGNPTLSVGTVNGGTATNIVPSSCKLSLDFRVLPGTKPEAILDDFLTRLRTAVPDEEFEINTMHGHGGVDTPADSPWVQNLLGPCQKRAGQEGPEGVNYFADSGAFNGAGIPCVLFGPGDIAQAHTKDEFLDLDQLYLAGGIVLDWLEAGCEKSLLS